jgi:hypothetical protein
MIIRTELSLRLDKFGNHGAGSERSHLFLSKIVGEKTGPIGAS